MVGIVGHVCPAGVSVRCRDPSQSHATGVYLVMALGHEPNEEMDYDTNEEMDLMKAFWAIIKCTEVAMIDP